MPKEEVVEKFKSLDDKIDNVILQSRRIFFSHVVDDKSAHDAIRKIWYLELSAPGKPILFVINSPGGSIDSGFAIWDTVQMIKSPVHTLVTGLAASMGSVLSLCAAEGKRFATPNSRIMIHQPRIGGPIHGQATDLDIQAKEIIKTKDQLVDLYVKKTGKTKKEIEKKLDRDCWLSADEAKKFGLIDGIVSSFKEVE
ncbi:MAG: ATP-dependent Clp protease proteolytic subunit 1 [Chlamydiales bacterium]|nr:ATP-dependent Clp protease proteolytic subunit 1 [Chlamydiales bacterium]MCH9619229.1 ATP-dependent Clp protease proteolytic subunit 1 [Chlamydiales bacterium]MCH9622491.1 ATP-dependent Clp protease proteolytic subunit 1 [Chlamydiales bacterium]